MSLAELLSAYDDTALTAIASKGVVIRAGKDVAAGKVRLSVEEKDNATLMVVNDTVTLKSNSVDAAQCTCPATGTCRHIIAAMMFLRDQAPTLTPTPESQPQAQSKPQPKSQSQSRSKPLPAFTVEAVEKFAGADWALACALADQAYISDSAGSVVVSFTNSEATVTFPNRMGLREAIYKGSVASHKRRSIAAAALVIAQENGIVLPEIISADNLRVVEAATLDRIANALKMATVSLAAGTFAQAQSQLLNIAIDTRAEAIPRVAAQLRGLSRQMEADTLRTASVTPTDLLSGMASTHALVDALRISPADPALLGVLARSFISTGPKSLAFLGAEVWQNPSDAKGLTMIFEDLQDGAIYRATQARAAGTDLNFDPRAQWNAPLWGLGTPSSMAGRVINLPDAAIASDNALGLNQSASHGAKLSLHDLKVHDDWQVATRAAKTQMGEGLRRRAGDAYLVLVPDKMESISFDAYAQKAVWNWIDCDGRICTLSLPEYPAMMLGAFIRQIKAGLVAFPPGGGSARLLAIWIKETGPISLGLDSLPRTKAGVGTMMERFAESKTQRADSKITPPDPVALFFERALEATLSGIGGASQLPPRLISDAEALGLSQVLDAQRVWKTSQSVEDALRLAYLLSAGRDLARGG